MSGIWKCTDEAGLDRALRAVTESARRGNLIVMPTDTVYGIGADAFNNDAVAGILRAKGRGPDMPVPVLVGSWETAKGLVADYSEDLDALIRAFWPGALSIVTAQAPSLNWNLGDTRGTVMLRMPNHPVAIAVLRAVGPMAVSSANLTGHPPPTTVVDAQHQLGSQVDMYLDGGESEVGTPSSIIDLSQAQPRLLREAALSAEAIAEVLGCSADILRGGA
ncbi:threonylcarbamoyl-AMP synthase [Corynebacterium poyangense]|uniref:L-threonylcarbamoyladenylate synthase n=1 Tax=Corynebacterium poyangense TaxID=2684405 RepID=A0A7H0SNC5_9CORY|nr:L-threonylcarbamoyladenylate synthase [Corynebacterium poyangense]MBZ8177077.1 threonylcarbamoyl-AMP synthase [Corynebacterium poyangense]QNQ90050.1 threonylcarbamoyl-AMP synthase [Corynebacterium poyangense]